MNSEGNLYLKSLHENRRKTRKYMEKCTYSGYASCVQNSRFKNGFKPESSDRLAANLSELDRSESLKAEGVSESERALTELKTICKSYFDMLGRLSLPNKVELTVMGLPSHIFVTTLISAFNFPVDATHTHSSRRIASSIPSDLSCTTRNLFQVMSQGALLHAPDEALAGETTACHTVAATSHRV